jgi:hypothetical protein
LTERGFVASSPGEKQAGDAAGRGHEGGF